MSSQQTRSRAIRPHLGFVHKCNSKVIKCVTCKCRFQIIFIMWERKPKYTTKSFFAFSLNKNPFFRYIEVASSSVSDQHKYLLNFPHTDNKPWRLSLFVFEKNNIIFVSLVYCAVLVHCYRVCLGSRLMKQDDNFWVNFYHFWIGQYFWKQLGQSCNWL